MATAGEPSSLERSIFETSRKGEEENFVHLGDEDNECLLYVV